LYNELVISESLAAAAAELGWSPTMLAARAGVGESAARKWLAGESIPGGDVLLTLMRELPGLRERLGFELIAA
jgi:hypothetical protein